MTHRTAVTRLLLSCVLGGATYALAAPHMPVIVAVVGAWIVVALAYTVSTWLRVRSMNADEVRAHATAEEPGRRGAHLLLIVASFASLIGVGVLLVAGAGKGNAVPVEAIVGTAAVGASWALVHIIFTLRYARLYYADPAENPIDFNRTSDPDYQDFAYLAFTLGMTYQVSDTALNSRPVRRLALRHAVLSYLLGVVVIASTINLVVQLASTQLGH